MSNLLLDRVAVITGGSRGLGLGIAQVYAREGAKIVIASRSASSVEKAVNDLRAAGAQVSGVACDVSDIAQVEALATHAIEKFGRIDIWVNNAGLSTPYGPTAHVPSAAFAKTISTNIIGVYNGSSVAMRYFLAQNSGKLINLLGRGDRDQIPLQNAYGSSKAWVRHFTLTLAKEYRHTKIGVFAFNPGLVMTDMLSNLEAVSGYEHLMQPLRVVTRLWGNPPEVPARRALWLASAATDGRTGLEENVLSIPFMMAGLLRETWRRITWSSTPLDEITVQTVQPAAIPPQ